MRNHHTDFCTVIENLGVAKNSIVVSLIGKLCLIVDNGWLTLKLRFDEKFYLNTCLFFVLMLI